MRGGGTKLWGSCGRGRSASVSSESGRRSGGTRGWTGNLLIGMFGLFGAFGV
jgi:hypothetical protein